MLNFCFDHVLNASEKLPWPNLVAMPRGSTSKDLEKIRGELSVNFPYVDFPRVLDYLKDNNIAYNIHSVESAPRGSMYVINVCRFNFGFDYFASLSREVKDLLEKNHLKIVFMYNEADSVLAIQRTLFDSCRKNKINPLNLYVTTSATTAEMLPNFYYFDDNEIRFKSSHRAYNLSGLPWNSEPRSKKMTLLSRVHKDWRAFFCSWYWHKGFDKQSYFSYRMIQQQDNAGPENNPLHGSVKFNPVRQKIFEDFIKHCPFSADNLDDQKHNSFGARVDEHFTNSYWNCVLETHLGLENDLPGVFLSEKTWKPIAHAQPFVLLGNAYSLQYLKSLGYRTFGECGVNETYDAILDPTARFNAVCELVENLHALSFEQLQSLHLKTKDVVEHNQRIFWGSNKNMLTTLFEKITGVD